MGKLLRAVATSATMWVALFAPRVVEGAACIPASQCCKICDAGQACGNSCISRTKHCHKGRGCACNLAELCAEDADAGS